MTDDSKTDTDADEKVENLEDEQSLAQELTGNEDKDDDSKDEDSDADESEKDHAPDTYEDFSLPEGFEPNSDTIGEFKELAKELDLSQETAQKLIAMQIKVQTQFQEAQIAEWDKVQKKWEDSARNDKEYGGKSFETNLGFAKTALDKFASDEFRETLEETGMGNHPELIRFLVNIGKGIGEDDVMKDGTKPGGDKTASEIMFPNMN